MPVYNSEEYVAEAIDSILGQTLNDFEFIIVDDGSGDSSAAIIRSYAARDDRIRCVMLEQNTGESAARNRGIEVARGVYIVNMDSDDVSLPTRLEKQLRFLQENPEIGAVGISLTVVNHDLTTSLGDNIVPRQHGLIVFNQFTDFLSLVVGGGMMIRSELLRACRRVERKPALWRRSGSLCPPAVPDSNAICKFGRDSLFVSHAWHQQD